MCTPMPMHNMCMCMCCASSHVYVCIACAQVQSIQASRHPDYRTPCVTLLMNAYASEAEGRGRAIDLIFLDAADYRLWMAGLQVIAC